MKGRPVLGVISGLLFGLFMAAVLQQFSLWPLDNLTVIGLPIAGAALGLVMAAWAPFGRKPTVTIDDDKAGLPPS